MVRIGVAAKFLPLFRLGVLLTALVAIGGMQIGLNGSLLPARGMSFRYSSVSGAQSACASIPTFDSGIALGSDLGAHQGAVTSIAFSPKGVTLASAGTDGVIRLWDLSQPDPLPFILGAHDAAVNSIAFSPDGSLLASGSSDNTVRIWNVDQPSATPLLLNHDRVVFAVAFSPDGTRVAAGISDETGSEARSSVWLWDFNQPVAPIGVLVGPQGGIASLSYSPAGNLVAAGSADGSIWLWDVSQPDYPGVSLRDPQDQSGVTSVAFSPDGAMLVAGTEDRSVLLWDIARLAAPTVLGGFNDAVTSVAFNTDGCGLATAGQDGTVQIRDLFQINAAPIVLYRHPGIVGSVAWSPDNQKIAAGTADGALMLWTSGSGIPTPGPSLTPSPTPSGELLFSADFGLFSPEKNDCNEYSYDQATGEWHLRVSCAGREAASFINLPLGDFQLELDVRKVSGSERAWYGVVIEENTGNGFDDHRFLISGIGTFSYEIGTFNPERTEQTRLVIVVPAENSMAVARRDNRNVITLKRLGQTVEMRVNGERILSEATKLPKSSQVRVAITAILPSTVVPAEGETDVHIEIAASKLTIYEVK